MIILLGGFTACALLGFLIALTDKSWEEKGVRLKMGVGWGIGFAILWTIVVINIIYCSYDSYLDQRAFYDATVEQYATAITMYEDKAVIDVESAAWTDLKYQGYQDNVAQLILDLRRNIVKYNELFVKKNKMHANPFFSWIIIGMDDDMKLIKMKIVSQE